MKRIFRLFAAAFAVVMASSCQEKVVLGPVSTNTFTATIATDTKTQIADNGVQTFRAGDFVLVSNRAEDLVVNGSSQFTKGGVNVSVGEQAVVDGHVVAEWVAITSEMISENGKKLTFTTSVEEPVAGYSMIIVKAKPLVYAVYKSGDITSRQVSATDSQRTVQDAMNIAFVPKGSSDVLFKSPMCFIRFKVSKTSAYGVSIAGMDPEFDLSKYFSAKPDGRILPSGTDKRFSLRCVSTYLYNAKNQYFYVPVVGGLTIEDGIKIYIWGNNTEYNTAINATADGYEPTATKIVNVPNLKSTTAGKIIDLGDLDRDLMTNAELWDAGKVFTIAGKQYSKATHGAAVVFNGDNYRPDGGVVFINNNSTLRYNNWDNIQEGNLIVMPNDPNPQNVNFYVYSSVRRTGDVAFKGVTISCRQGYFAECYNIDLQSTSMSFEKCKFNGVCLASANLSTAYFASINLQSCDIYMPGANNDRFIGYNPAAQFGDIIFNNCIFYAPTQKLYRTAVDITLNGKFEVTNCTYINCAPASDSDNYILNTVQCTATSTVNLDNNLVYTTDSCNREVAIIHKNEVEKASSSTLTGLHYYGPLRACNACWTSDGTKLTENPFSSMNFETGTFVNTAAAASYGATR